MASFAPGRGVVTVNICTYSQGVLSRFTLVSTSLVNILFHRPLVPPGGASLKTQRAQRIIIFPLPLRGRQWKSNQQLTLRKRQKASILWLQGANMGILLTEGLSRFAFRRLSEKQKNQKLCALCGSAVNNFLIKTLFGVVVDLFLEFSRQERNLNYPF